MLSLTVKKWEAFKFDGVAESDNTGGKLNVTPLVSFFPHIPLAESDLIQID